MKKKYKILIVGGTGFIGYHFAKKCLENNCSVVSISTKKPTKKRYLRKVKYLICDISKKSSLKKIIKDNFDFIVNLGGHVNHKDYVKTYNSHYRGVKNLAEIFIKKNIKLFIQIGSGGEYGRTVSPHKEGKENEPKTIYNKAKFMASKYLIKLYNKKKFPVSILRLYQVYGPKQDVNRLIPIVISNCLKNNKFPCSDGKQFRNFVYIQDVSNAIYKCLCQYQKAKGEIINIGSNKNFQVKKLIKIIRNKIGQGIPQFGKIPLREDERLRFYPSLVKAKKILNWRAKISLTSGLNRTIREFY